MDYSSLVPYAGISLIRFTDPAITRSQPYGTPTSEK